MTGIGLGVGIGIEFGIGLGGGRCPNNLYFTIKSYVSIELITLPISLF
jgi:hypothetical protein